VRATIDCASDFNDSNVESARRSESERPWLKLRYLRAAPKRSLSLNAIFSPKRKAFFAAAWLP
jgi:hypothetical protein